MTVVKVGGSLYGLPDLRERLVRFLLTLGSSGWLLVPGGGPTADVVRDLDRVHELGESRSHWLALRACSLNAYVLHDLLPTASVVDDPRGSPPRAILDPHAFVLRDEGSPGCLPHHWNATSDSVAARAAWVADRPLVLLKSVTVPAGMSWEAAAGVEYVDPLFPSLVRMGGLRVRAVNLRDGPFG